MEFMGFYAANGRLAGRLQASFVNLYFQTVLKVRS
jgi:hypothetical protein